MRVARLVAALTVAYDILVGDSEPSSPNEPIYVGLASGLVVFVVGSLLSKPTSPEVMAEWDRRSRGEETVRREVTDATI